MAEEIKIDFDELDAKKDAPAPKLNDLRPQTEEKQEKDEVKAERDAESANAEKKFALSPDEGIEKLKKQLESERTARQAAEKRAQDASEAEARARGETQTTQLDLIKSAISSLTASNESLKAQYRQVRTDGDIDREWEIQKTLSENSAKLIQLEAGKTALEKQPKPAPRAQADPVEQFVSNMTPKSASWVRAHPDYVTDTKKNRMMIAAHELAVTRDLAPDTDEYFASVEKTLGLAKDEPIIEDRDDPMADAAKPAPKVAPPAAPVSRSGNGAGGRPNVVTLSSEEREMARATGQSDEEYARNKMALKKEGRLN